MSRADVELIQGLYEAWVAGDRETALAGVDPAIEWVQAPDALEVETRRGYEGVEYSMAQWTEAFEDFGFEIQALRDLGDGRVLASLFQHGRSRGSAVPVEGTLFQLWTVRDGRAIRAEMFRIEADALEAASRPADRA
jgi:ketosteroid isomerase-like protein